MFVADRLLAKKKQIASIKQILGLKAFTMLRGGGGGSEYTLLDFDHGSDLLLFL
jgi:hypothetical protein